MHKYSLQTEVYFIYDKLISAYLEKMIVIFAVTQGHSECMLELLAVERPNQVYSNETPFFVFKNLTSLNVVKIILYLRHANSPVCFLR